MPLAFPVVGFLLLSAFTMRPSLLGEMFTPVSMVFAAAALGAGVVSFGGRAEAEMTIAGRNIIIAALVCLLWAYLSLHSVFQ
ncbi:MAG: hypothetical protein Q8P48_05795, partial [Deltaproteobacteria bacterium]|nr:hypothetical protein [Deltaproteobacteria bacterium]